MATSIKTVWKFGVQDTKDFKKWHWSKEFDSFDECYDAYRTWVEQDRGRHALRIIPRTIYLPTPEDGKA